METIKSLQNEKVKNLVKLHSKKHRNCTKQFLVEGEHLIKEALYANCVSLLILQEDTINIFDYAGKMMYVSQDVMNKISQNVSEVKMIAVCDMIDNNSEEFDRFIMLDNLQDPGNVGTIIRTALSFNYPKIYLSKNCVDVYNDKLIRSTQGAIFKVDIEICDLKDKINELIENNYQVFGTSLKNAMPLKQIIRVDKYGIILGNEGSGVSNEVLDITSQNIFIEINNFESLNVAVAASICMYGLIK